MKISKKMLAEGRIVPTLLQIEPTELSLQYGFGLFESLRYEPGRIFYYREHLSRLRKACGHFNMKLKASLISEKKIAKLADFLGITAGVWKIKIMILRQLGSSCRHLVFFSPVPRATTQIKLFINPDISDSPLYRYKTCNYMFTSRLMEKKRGYSDFCRLGAGNLILECGFANLGYSRNKKLYLVDPAKAAMLPGTTQRFLTRYYGKWFTKLVLRPGFSPSELDNADEVFYLNSMKGVRNVHSIDKRKTTWGDTGKAINMVFFKDR